MGSKPLSLMHGVFEPLRQKSTELPKDVIMPDGNIDDRLNIWFENFKLIEFAAMNKDIKSFTSFQDACKRLFQIPEIRRACFETTLAYNAINGAYCNIHQNLGIPLPNRTQLNATNLWNNAQHRACVDVPKNERDDRQNLAHKTFKTTTAYAKCPQLESHIEKEKAIKFYTEKLSTGEALVWLLGRTDDDGSSKKTPFWKLDHVSRGTNDQGEDELITLAPRKRVQSILQRHLNDSIANIHLDDRYSDRSTFASPLDCSSKRPIELLKHYQPLNENRRTLMCTSLTGAKTGWALFHISNRKNWEFPNPRDFRHAMDMKFSKFLNEFKELSISSGNRDSMGNCPGVSHAGAAHANSRQTSRGGRCLNNCTKGGKYALHSAVQNVLAKALNGQNLKAVVVEAHPYATESTRTDISISSAENPGEILYYVDTTVTNAQQKKIPSLKKLSDADNIVCCRDLLLNETVVNNHIFSATANKIRKYKGCHDNACANGRPPSSIVVPFAVDTLGNFCSVAVIFLKKLAKTKFSKIPGSKEFQDLTASTWVNTTCRDIQTAIIKTCAYNNRSALKLAFGEEYDKLYPGSIYSPPSYNENFSSSEG